MKTLRYHLELIISNILFGISFSIYVSLLHGVMQPTQLFVIQLLFAFLLFTPAAITRRNFFRLSLNDFGSIFIIALLVVFGWWYMLMKGAAYTNPIDASTISTIGPIFTLLTSIVAYPRKVARGETIGIIIALSGVMVLLIDRGRMLVGEGGEGYGNAIILCAVVAIAANTVLIAPVLRRHGVIVVMGWYYLIGVILALPMIIEELPTISALYLSRSDLFEIGYILILGSTLPLYLLYVGAEHLSVTYTAVYRYIQPIIATILAIWRGQAIIDRTNLVGAVLIFFGMLCVTLSTTRTTRE